MAPKITVLLCTVRPDQGYIEHPEWHVIGKVVEDLSKQTFTDFELVVVDGLYQRDHVAWKPAAVGGAYLWPHDETAAVVGEWHILDGFQLTWLPPKPNLWVRNKKVAISTYRNTGIAAARGELIVNLDDCCELPPDYLEHFWSAWSRHKA
jgi:glycosyltransferase involved in cell wall biosynthesis